MVSLYKVLSELQSVYDNANKICFVVKIRGKKSIFLKSQAEKNKKKPLTQQKKHNFVI